MTTMRDALEAAESWIDRWAPHVGNCEGGDGCTCGRTAVLHEASTALSPVQDMENHVPQQETDRQIASLRQQLQDCEIGLSTWDDGKNSEYWLRYPARAGEAVEEITSRLPREEQRSSPEWRPDPKTVEGWQPIETAPKDGTRFLFTTGSVVSVGFYINGKAFAADSFGGERNTEPTHWMPLPAPPRSSSYQTWRE